MTSKHRMSTKEIVYLAAMIAVTVAISRVFLIPVPMTHGNVNLCDAGIFIAALLFGKKQGAIVGGASGFLLDLISGYSQYMIFSLIIHGVEGFLVGWLAEKYGHLGKIASLIVGIVWMVFGYFLADSLLYQIQTGLVGLPTNSIQGLLGALIAYPVYLGIRSRVKNPSHS
ncbi:substrate-specific component PdxU2 of predicted pyridoxin-related ECF transporter [Agrilactobacillus composti DSM 18527 = JCM 14202]|nr:ECF transporter S component [Agrilactobacillus composti]GAF38837.1 substrate-specific component PdxU2 of predicted pyridoxin-related ECF transporter [Agrilactobacillus composti DSM 18527 = JCM 14202]